MEPLVGNTSETLAGPLALGVYAGDSCSGELYQDDGKSFAFERGGFLRERFACPHPAWWKEIHVDIYGWTPAKGQVMVNGAAANVPIGRQGGGIGSSMRDDGEVHDVQVR